jgi:hypothetical protein
VAALSLTLMLFLFWGVVGLGALAALSPTGNATRQILLAPAVGAAATLLPVFHLSRLGWPVRRFGPALTVVLLLAAAELIRRFRPALPGRTSACLAGVCLLALFLTGRPMLRFGFDWLSYANDDMANYVLASHRFLDHGYFAVPDKASFVHASDPDLNYWFVHAIGGIRPGADLLLAWVLSLTGLDGFQAFMPVVLALHLVLIASTGALVCRPSSSPRAALLACLLLSVSALAALGVLYQLIAQVFGLALLCACAAVLLPWPDADGRGPFLGPCALAGILVSALVVVYPEVLPFLGGAMVLQALVCFRRRGSHGKRMIAAWGAAAGFCLLLVNTYIPSAVRFLSRQARHGVEAPDLQFAIFPYFLVPSGLANLWGLLPVDRPAAEPWVSAAIAAGGLLLGAAAAATVWRLWSGDPAAVMSAVMLAAGAALFARRSDFGSFKLAMYMQPFLLGTMASAWDEILRRRQEGP